MFLLDVNYFNNFLCSLNNETIAKLRNQIEEIIEQSRSKEIKFYQFRKIKSVLSHHKMSPLVRKLVAKYKDNPATIKIESVLPSFLIKKHKNF
ncbi:hypothetical protein MHBO_002275 [Bonamia ostreae]